MAAQHHTAQHRLAGTIVTMQLGIALTVLLGLMFLSGALFYLYVFNYDIGPYFTVTRAVHFYAGLASIPFLVAKYGATGLRFAGYYLRLPRFYAAGPPRLIPRIFSPLLALDFFVLYFSGLYMLFHYYYTVTNIPPVELKPVQLHLWAALLAVPLIAIHLGEHLLVTLGTLSRARAGSGEGARKAGTAQPLTRRAFVATVLLGGLGLSWGYQNTSLRSREAGGLFIARIPQEERGGPGDFPVETLFGNEEVDSDSWRLTIDGAVGQETVLTYEQLLALPAVSRRIRLSCVSGWTAVPEWRGPLLRDVLALAEPSADWKHVYLHSVTNYGVPWHRNAADDEAILATHVNGAPLSQNHGFPARIIRPGFPGQNMVKQIDRITVSTDPIRFDPDFRLVRHGPSGGELSV